MFSTELAKKYISVTQEDILARATELDIYEAYLGKIKVGQIYNSPLRKDENPSFGLFYSHKTGQLLYKDLATGECGNVFKFVKLYTGITDNHILIISFSYRRNIATTTTTNSFNNKIRIIGMEHSSVFLEIYAMIKSNI